MLRNVILSLEKEGGTGGLGVVGVAVGVVGEGVCGTTVQAPLRQTPLGLAGQGDPSN